MTTTNDITPVSEGGSTLQTFFFSGLFILAAVLAAGFVFQGPRTQQIHAQAVPTVLAASRPATYQELARTDAVGAGIDPVLFVRQIQQESGFNPSALSPAGAIGIAQFMPETAKGLGLDPHDPVASLLAAARLMASYARAYGGDYAKALAAYNAGPGMLANALRCGTGWKACLPDETRGYIAIVMRG